MARSPTDRLTRPADSGAALAFRLMLAVAVALTGLTVWLTWWALTEMRHEEPVFMRTLGNAAIVALGGATAAAWLTRLGQWWLAARAQPQPVMVQAYLTVPVRPRQRDFIERPAQARLAEREIRPAVQVWVRVTGPGERRRYQRVLWRPSLAYLVGVHSGVLRAGPGPVGVIDVDGLGRLWPTSELRDSPPHRFELERFAIAHRRERRLWAALSPMLAPLGLVPLMWESLGTPWVLVYAPLTWLAILLWLGLTPPAWVPHRPASPDP
jgi:hypothetical protein